jgi:uncharacterized membrane protein YccF (DUF307 family)
VSRDDGDPAMTVTRTESTSGPPFLIRAIWFVFVGWWLAGVVSAGAWLIGLTVIGLPLTFWIFNRIPTVLTLRPRRLATTTTVSADGSQMAVVRSSVRQPAFWKRVLYFVFVGWWFSAFWIAIAWLLAVLIVTLPLAVMMYNRLPAVTTMHRY